MSDNPELDLPELNGVQLSPATAIASLGLNFALKWHDMRLIKDGTLYQQKKMEGENFQLIDLPDVFETAKQFEQHILNAPNRLSDMVNAGVIEMLEEMIAEEDAGGEAESPETDKSA